MIITRGNQLFCTEGRMMMNAIIVVTSGGSNWVAPQEEPGKMLGMPIENRAFDVTNLLEDPVDRPELKNVDGTDPAAQEFTMSQPVAKEFLKDRVAEVKAWLKKTLINGESRILHIGIGCRGGFQRSVTLAELLTKQLREDQAINCPVVLHHLTMAIPLAIREIIAKQ